MNKETYHKIAFALEQFIHQAESNGQHDDILENAKEAIFDYYKHEGRFIVKYNNDDGIISILRDD